MGGSDVSSAARLWALGCATLLLGAAGCARLQRVPPTTTTKITTQPDGAAVYVDGVLLCPTTPCIWPDNLGQPQRYHLQLRKSGYQEVALYIDKEMAIWWKVGAYVLAPVPVLGWAVNILDVSYELPDTLAFELQPLAAIPVENDPVEAAPAPAGPASPPEEVPAPEPPPAPSPTPAPGPEPQ